MTFQDDLNRVLSDAYQHINVTFAETVPAETITVKKLSYMMPLSIEQALDAGIMTEEQARAAGWTPYVPPPTPWHRRLRWRWQAWRERAGRKVGSWIAGVDLSERDEDW